MINNNDCFKIDTPWCKCFFKQREKDVLFIRTWEEDKKFSITTCELDFLHKEHTLIDGKDVNKNDYVPITTEEFDDIVKKYIE